MINVKQTAENRELHTKAKISFRVVSGVKNSGTITKEEMKKINNTGNVNTINNSIFRLSRGTAI